MAETWTPVGKVTPTPKGAWSSSTSYARLDIVSNNGASYIAIQGVPAGTAITNTSYWQKFADKGDTGATGATGNGVASIVVTETSTSGSAHNYRMAITMTNGDVTNVDYTVTDGAVTSVNGRTGAVTGLAEEEDLIKAFPNDTASGDIASFPDGAEMPVKGMKINVEPYQNLNGYEYPWVGGAGKNKLPTPIKGTYSSNGLTLTVDDKGVITVSGTTTASGTLLIPLSQSYVIPSSVMQGGTGCMYLFNSFATGQNNAFTMYYDDTRVETWQFTVANRKADNWVGQAGKTINKIGIQYTSGQTYSGTFAPMFSEDGTTDATSFIPYSNICPIYPANGKNLLPNTMVENTLNGVTFSKDENGIISLSGTASANIAKEVGGVYLEVGDYYLNRISRTTSGGAYIQVVDSTKTSQLCYSYGSDAKFTLSSAQTVYLRIAMPNGTNASGVKVYPMIRPVKITDSTYVPYRAIPTRRSGLAWDSSSVGHYIGADGTIGSSASFHYSEYIPVEPKTYQYAFVSNGATITYTCRIHGYDSNKNWVRQLTTLTDILNGKYSLSFTPTSDIAYIRISNSLNSANKNEAITPDITEYYYSRDYNMWDEEWEVGGINADTGQNAGDASRIRSVGYIPCLPNTKYYVANKLGNLTLFYYESDKDFISYQSGDSSNTSVTTPSNCYYMRFRVVSTTYASGDITINYSNPSQVGYGGVLDVETGLLTVTHNAVDMGTLTWTQASTNTQGVYRQTSTSIQNLIKKPSSSSQKVDITCSNYKTVAGDEVYLRYPGICVTTTGGVGVYDEKYSADSSSSAFKTSVEGATLVYPLASPVQYQLTPTQVKTLLGYNNIWTDSGTVEVNYLADTSLYIQKLTGSTEEDMIANANIENGKYFMVGNELFLSTSAIAQGASIVVGTNCIKTNLADALNALNS